MNGPLAIIFPAVTALNPQQVAADPPVGVLLLAGAAVCAVLCIAAMVGLRLRALRQLSTSTVLSDHVFSAFFGDAQVGIAVVDEHGAIVRANSILETMIGYEEEALVGMLYVDLVDHPNNSDGRDRIIGALDRFGESRHLVLRRSDGGFLRARFVVAPAPATMSRKHSVVFVEEVGVQHPGGSPSDPDRGLRRASPYHEAMGAPSPSRSSSGSGTTDELLVAGMHDEIRTPLTVILGSASLLKTVVPSDHAELVHAIEASSQRLLNTADALLCLARLRYRNEPTLVEVFDSRSMVLEAVEAQRPSAAMKDLEIRCVLPDEPALAEADRAAAARIVGQFVNNAIKFTDSGSVTIQVEQRDDSIRIDVVDTGAGFDEEASTLLFSPFYQGSTGSRRRHRGLGLGLTLARELAEATGGAVDAVGRPGAGARFSLSLPARASSSRSGEMTRAA